MFNGDVLGFWWFPVPLPWTPAVVTAPSLQFPVVLPHAAVLDTPCSSCPCQSVPCRCRLAAAPRAAQAAGCWRCPAQPSRAEDAGAPGPRGAPGAPAAAAPQPLLSQFAFGACSLPAAREWTCRASCTESVSTAVLQASEEPCQRAQEPNHSSRDGIPGSWGSRRAITAAVLPVNN